jgi:hypothetical protein
MKPSPWIAHLLHRSLVVRANTLVPLSKALQRLQAARASGAKRTELLADTAWQFGDGLAAVSLWRDLERDQPDNADWPMKIALACRERGDLDATERVLLGAQARGLFTEAIELELLRCGRLSRRSNVPIDDAEAIVADPQASPGKVFPSAYHLTTQNRLEGARAGFTRLLGDKRYGPLAKGQLAAVALLEEARARGRPDIPGRVSPAQSSILVREPSSDTLVVGFALPEGTLGLSLNAVHAMLSSTGVNALYLYDSRQLFHLSGSDRFGPGYRAMIDGVHTLAAELGTRRLITVGGSGTGYTSIHAGIDLGADGALAFAPGTMMLPTSNPGVARNAYTVRRLQTEVLPMMKNLRPFVQARATCPRIEIYYGASNTRDIMHASNLSGLRGVALHPVPALERHDCLTEMAHRGYRDLLRAFDPQ